MICEAEDFPIIPSFLPSIPEHALVCYVLDHTANDGATVLFKEGKTWTMNGSEKIHITVSAFQDPANNPNIFAADIVTIHPHVLLANQISLEGLTDDNGIPLALERYIVEPPDTMEVSMSEMPAPKIQYTYEDGSAMYVEEDGFNKLADSNIKEILYVKLANGTTVPSSYYTLIPKGGLIVWKNAALIANAPRIQEIKYTYYKPTHLRFKTLNGLYDIVGYSSKTMEKLGSYVIFDKEETKPDVHDPELMIEYAELLPSGKTKKDISRISFICTNSFFRARQEGDNIIVSKVAEDTAPVIHNGYYYINGKEYWFFANQYEQKENKLEGVEIENAETIRNILLLKQSAVNYLQNSRMECNKLGVHCMIDFTYPRNEANQEPLKHIGACDSFAGWQDYGMIRTLVPSQNGYATTFTTRDDNGYAILDITQAIGKHHTISCLFSGSLSFWLGQEIKILGERTRKTIFCKRIQAFTAHDGIAYTSLKDIDLNQGRYYVIVEGNGQLDEILIHDAEQLADIEAWHVKAIDKLGFITQEQEAEGTITDLEYDTEFMTYTNLETGTDGKLRTGTTVDWNISQFNEFNLSKGNMRKFLYRNQSLVAQANGAIYETEPIEIRYAHSIRGLACKINRYIEGKFKGFSVTILASANQYSNYEPIATESNTNLITFPPEVRRKFYKVRITAKEGQVVEQIQILAAYKEVSTESLPVYYHPEGSAVTKIFDTGANGDYKFKEVISDQNSLWKAIYMRGARISMNKEMIWTSWKDIATLPEFPNCQLFQFKILMEGKNSEAKINGFRLEVLSHV